MSKSTASAVLLAGVGLVCAVLLIWLWPNDEHDDLHDVAVTTGKLKRVAPAALAPAASDSTPPPALSPELRAMLGDLLQLLAAGAARNGEALLTFKDDAAMQRFLSRAQAAGLDVLAQLGPLRSVRARFNSASALESELLENAGDYENLAANGLMGIPQPPAKENRGDVNQVPFRNDTLAFSVRAAIAALGDAAP
jgi:hypothetical protein